MEKILNDSIIPFVTDSQISFSTVQQLVIIREFIDRISDKKYISPESAQHIEKRFGTAPNILTWGDYFQTDLAMIAVNDGENFSRIADTVRFDIMSSWDIFSSARPEFMEWVEAGNRELQLSSKDTSLYTEEENEIVHLGILLEYFKYLGINGDFYESELIWYNSYFEEDATGTEDYIIQ